MRQKARIQLNLTGGILSRVIQDKCNHKGLYKREAEDALRQKRSKIYSQVTTSQGIPRAIKNWEK
jgi:hypothetical protein